ncbi:nitrite reductase [Paraferrimonas sedimenticola]|uniref:Cytochrome c-type protein NrfB-like domain-containing protein n=1 Tax=Paraferrimonas sedimenticola TaxID=375674 RepID=A0AA37RUH2_9GAMM|nr:nitrite reductase [Paraferrimonas sedimenticola]GLP95434.1 hypothetical protein GCM10007895_07400 [Paraferrimonas sedimenticola]
MYPQFFHPLLLGLKQFLTAVLVVLLCLPVLAEANDSSSCLKCHRKNGQMLGLHGAEGLDLHCQDCHGAKGKHPRGESALIDFGQQAEIDKVEQTKPCMKCHESEKLQRGHWTHDVHQNRLSCSACHLLHPEQDPVVTMSPEAITQLCVECHQAPKGEQDAQ